MLPAFGREWLPQVRNAFLIRDPAAVLASYVQKRGDVTLADIGVVQQREIFDAEADRLGRAPPVVDGADVLEIPPRVLSQALLGAGYPVHARRCFAGRRDAALPTVCGRLRGTTRSSNPRDSVRRRRLARLCCPTSCVGSRRPLQPHYAALAMHR